MLTFTGKNGLDQQWKTATFGILDRYGKAHLTALTSEVEKAGKYFNASVNGLRLEWQQREKSLQRARTWNVILIVVSLLLLLSLLLLIGRLTASGGWQNSRW